MREKCQISRDENGSDASDVNEDATDDVDDDVVDDDDDDEGLETGTIASLGIFQLKDSYL